MDTSTFTLHSYVLSLLLKENFVELNFDFIFRLKNILFPTLICTCFNSSENKKIVEQEVSPTLFAIFLEVCNFFLVCT